MTDRDITIFWRICVYGNLLGLFVNCGLFVFGHGFAFLAFGAFNGAMSLVAQVQLERHYKL